MSNDCKAITIICKALKEDVGAGDITTRGVVARSIVVQGKIIAKEAGVIAGLPVAEEVFRQVDKKIKFSSAVKDGTWVKKGEVIATLTGPAQGILTGERVALNFLQRLSGIATLTHSFVFRVSCLGSLARILDTRKTTPGLRELEKYAVRCGGGTNHRLGLYDAILIKDNHLAIAGGVQATVSRIKKEGWRRMKIEVEAKTLAQVKQAIALSVDRILLDNMNIKILREAVRLCQKAGIKTEASGGISLKNVARVAATGVDFISVGALTHSAKALDISLKVNAG
ncbi:nicotinate-nucleotide diphosphorylase (carboxylating) [Candidatus Saganbacteria bacterium CG08_land_8_20_14_0_20_45_16]|uniref:Probable nicotinate-nucleotide pyrophosphorylase [carboxylating] n=1 Tax=Candidatus Saganbacteria bacterium CG08_land_8_20_14_0_20_45_16 TaxID=2014293 RepID=A0A2H0Y1K6_UNCSA|nr:MAG: nicotinate-nucleotide diphosphorylase (carboxylating) [Candidatus Saganbacteria bacterium CG08_land_8_20_14_0_20_45_16]